jgi:hypothetical protein
MTTSHAVRYYILSTSLAVFVEKNLHCVSIAVQFYTHTVVPDGGQIMSDIEILILLG